MLDGFFWVFFLELHTAAVFLRLDCLFDIRIMKVISRLLLSKPPGPAPWGLLCI
ncbi:rCG42226 [Rattus norvegicus]|uniref:RCG42226 n=1 Tax=Rattus norvegicus TaxID=10116 RepID=A6K051_RAT|nr:rCG42226 [Rattus norvegicus]